MGLSNTKYIVDEMARKAGHEVPVAHCTLNPIELAWAQVKGHVKRNTSKFNLDEVKQLAQEGFEVVTKERWADLVKHVRDKMEDHYWQNDNLDLQERFHVSEFVIHVGGESDDDPTSELGSTSNSDSLNDSVAATDNDQKKLIQSCATRWNSCYEMLLKLLEMRWPVSAVLSDDSVTKRSDRYLNLKTEQWTIVEELIAILKPLQVATNFLQYEYNCSLSCILPVIHGLDISLQLSRDDSFAIRQFKETFRQQIRSRWSGMTWISLV